MNLGAPYGITIPLIHDQLGVEDIVIESIQFER